MLLYIISQPVFVSWHKNRQSASSSLAQLLNNQITSLYYLEETVKSHKSLISGPHHQHDILEIEIKEEEQGQLRHAHVYRHRHPNSQERQFQRVVLAVAPGCHSNIREQVLRDIRTTGTFQCSPCGII